MTIRGAWSTDRIHRKVNISWWENEELSYNQMLLVYDLYVKLKPKIVITHDCPRSINNELFGYLDKSITGNGLEFMLQEHKPLQWVFGHHHIEIDVIIDGVNFICLPELGTKLIG